MPSVTTSKNSIWRKINLLREYLCDLHNPRLFWIWRDAPQYRFAWLAEGIRLNLASTNECWHQILVQFALLLQRTFFLWERCNLYVLIFRCKRQSMGIRQGCPLSPWLFVIVMSSIGFDIRPRCSWWVSNGRILGLEFVTDDTIYIYMVIYFPEILRLLMNYYAWREWSPANI